MTNRRKLLIGILLAIPTLLVLTAYFGGPMIERILDSSLFQSDGRKADTTLSQPTLSGTAPLDSSATSRSADSDLVARHGPLVVGGVAYSFEVLRDTGSEKPPEAARRVRVIDATGRTVYEENLFLRRDSTSRYDWIEFYPSVLEDDKGNARAFEFKYLWHPSAPGSGEAFTVVAPRRDSLAVLTPRLIGYFGQMKVLPSGSQPRSLRLMPGNQLIIESGRGWFDAMIPIQLDFDCTPRGGDCVRIALTDSIGGLARFAVRASSQNAIDTTAVVELFAAPHGGAVAAASVAPGDKVEILGGAGRVYFAREAALYLSGEDDWLQIRVNGRTGWITSAKSFTAIGLSQVG